MKITSLQVHILRAPDDGRPHWVSHFIVPKANEILVRLQTDEGIEGIRLDRRVARREADPCLPHRHRRARRRRRPARAGAPLPEALRADLAAPSSREEVVP